MPMTPYKELLVGSVKQKPDGSATGGGVVYDFSHQILAKVELVSDSDFSGRLNQYIPEHVFRLQLSQQKDFDIGVCFLFFSFYFCRKYFCIIVNNYITFVQIFLNVREFFMFDRPILPF